MLRFIFCLISTFVYSIDEQWHAGKNEKTQSTAELFFISCQCNIFFADWNLWKADKTSWTEGMHEYNNKAFSLSLCWVLFAIDVPSLSSNSKKLLKSSLKNSIFNNLISHSDTDLPSNRLCSESTRAATINRLADRQKINQQLLW